jgi:hypothetical protein
MRQMRNAQNQAIVENFRSQSQYRADNQQNSKPLHDEKEVVAYQHWQQLLRR